MNQDCLHLAQQHPDAILLDMSMPGMDGFEVYQRLQSNPITQGIPVILLTARVLPSDREQFNKMGVAGVISKPLELTTFTTEISELLGWDE